MFGENEQVLFWADLLRLDAEEDSKIAFIVIDRIVIWNLRTAFPLRALSPGLPASFVKQRIGRQKLA